MLLGGSNGRLTVTRVRGRPVSEWLRRLMNDMVETGRMPRAKAVRTCRVVRLLIAKAEQNECSCLLECEFDSAARVIREPTWQSSLEVELAWSLFDISQEDKITCEDFAKLRACWAALGRVCSDAEASSIQAAARNEDGSMMTRERYEVWMQTGCADQHAKPHHTPPPEAESAMQPQHMSFMRDAGPRDHARRSKESRLLSLMQAPINLAVELMNFSNMRGLRPSRPSTARSRKADADSGDEFQPVGRPSTAGSRKGDTYSFDEFQSVGPSTPGPSTKSDRKVAPQAPSGEKHRFKLRKAKLQPYMEVKAPVIRPDGQTVYQVGTLMSGWGTKNEKVKIPHSEPPEKAKRKGTPSKTAVSRRASQGGDRRHEDDYVLVLLGGIEKWAPREAVMPICPLQGKAKEAVRPLSARGSVSPVNARGSLKKRGST